MQFCDMSLHVQFMVMMRRSGERYRLSRNVFTVFLRTFFRSRWLCQIFVLGLFYFRARRLVHKSPATFYFPSNSFYFPTISFDVPFISFCFLSRSRPQHQIQENGIPKMYRFLCNLHENLVGGAFVSTCPVWHVGVVN